MRPQPKYGIHQDYSSCDEQWQKWMLEREVDDLKKHISVLNEIITELATELPQDLVLKHTVQPWEKDKSFTPPKTLNDLVTVLREHLVVANTITTDTDMGHRIPKSVKGRPDRVPEEHFIFYTSS